MTQPSAALVKSDLASVRIVGEGAARWEITPLPGAEVTARSLRARADEAARWIAMQPAIKRRLGVVVVDVDESICAWLRTPSLAQPVVAATLRSNAQDWGDLMPVASYEALVSPQPASKKRGKKGELPAPETDGGVSIGVLCMPDAILRLWLDALDSMNVRVGTILSLWHAMARVWPGESSGVTASVLIDGDQRLVWAWAQGGELLCGSVVTLMGAAEEESGPPADAQESIPAPADETGDALAASAKRLTLDWLTWSSHLGRVPEKVQIIGMGADKLVASLREHWTATRFDTRSHSDPVEHTLQQLIATIDDKNVDDPRRTLTRLTHRPTRAVRTRYRLTAATLLATVQSKENPRALNAMGFATRKLGNVDGALPYYARALALEPNYVQAREYLGEAFLAKGDLASAREQLGEIERRAGAGSISFANLKREIGTFEAQHADRG